MQEKWVRWWWRETEGRGGHLCSLFSFTDAPPTSTGLRSADLSRFRGGLTENGLGSPRISDVANHGGVYDRTIGVDTWTACVNGRTSGRPRGVDGVNGRTARRGRRGKFDSRIIWADVSLLCHIATLTLSERLS